MKSRHFRMNGKWVTAAEFGEQISDLIEKGWTLTPPHPTDTETLAEVLTDAEQEDLLIASHTVEPIQDTGKALFATVERIIAARIVQARAGEGALRERVLTLLPDCYVTHDEAMPCLRFIGGTFDNGAVWTEDMCCLPCRVRAALTTADPT